MNTEYEPPMPSDGDDLRARLFDIIESSLSFAYDLGGFDEHNGSCQKHRLVELSEKLLTLF